MKNRQLIVAGVCFALALLVPVIIQDDYTLQILFRVFLFAALGLAWNLVGGYAGQLSLGHAAYFGVGAYGLALFSKIGINPWISVILGVVLSVISATLIGAVSFRLRGPYFALCTIAHCDPIPGSDKEVMCHCTVNTAVSAGASSSSTPPPGKR